MTTFTFNRRLPWTVDSVHTESGTFVSLEWYTLISEQGNFCLRFSGCLTWDTSQPRDCGFTCINLRYDVNGNSETKCWPTPRWLVCQSRYSWEASAPASWRPIVCKGKCVCVCVCVGWSSEKHYYLDSILVLTLRRLMSYIYGAPILDVSRSHTTTQHSR